MRERIATATADVYGRLGYHRARVEDVLERAGISRPTFYRSFASLHEAIDLVVARANAELSLMLARALAGDGSPGQKVEAAIDAYLRWGQGLGPVAKRLYEELHDPASPAGLHRAALHREAADSLARVSAALGRAPVDPLVYQTLLRVSEDVASPLFSGEPAAPGELERRRAVLMRVVFATLAESGEVAPPLPRPPASV